MSWKTINEVLGLAAIDPEFLQALRTNPGPASYQRGFVLSSEEIALFEKLDDLGLHEFGQYVFDKLDPQMINKRRDSAFGYGGQSD